ILPSGDQSPSRNQTRQNQLEHFLSQLERRVFPGNPKAEQDHKARELNEIAALYAERQRPLHVFMESTNSSRADITRPVTVDTIRAVERLRTDQALINGYLAQIIEIEDIHIGNPNFRVDEVRRVQEKLRSISND